MSSKTTKRDFLLRDIPPIERTFAENKFRGALNPRINKILSSAGLISEVLEDSRDTLDSKNYKIVKGNYEAIDYLPSKSKMRELFKIQSTNVEYLNAVESINRNKVIAIHVRLGDYLRHPEIYDLLNQSYYDRALEICKSEFPNAVIWIFTDDIKECISRYPKLYSNAEKIVSENLSTLEVLDLMSRCHSIIAANSTFSWWSTYLASTDSLTIIPSRFNNIEGDQTASKLTCSQHLVLEV